ncbi:uncharacterized protein B0T23DRAFT_395039 [Neurospora hispaniola]|uniref:Uncharacterized protein n=1 Tax=Neurospora hispaniola TaxID=588809 RepID=A0AAJ0IAX3_9PEZI|nr:hypothetical protein B0T23DRAFT_395039 [Neurospora hispaniola]
MLGYAVLSHAYAQCWMTKTPTHQETNRPVSGMQLELKTADVQDVDNDARKNRAAPPSVSRELVGGILAMKNTPPQKTPTTPPMNGTQTTTTASHIKEKYPSSQLFTSVTPHLLGRDHR